MSATFRQKLPVEWSEKRLKFAAPLRNERVEATSEHADYLGLENIESWTGKLVPTANGVHEPDEEATGGTANRFRRDDVLFGKLRPYLAKALHAHIDGVCTTELLVLKPCADLYPRFLLYTILSPEFIGQVDASTFGAKMPRANWDFVGSMKIPVPSLGLQRQIGDYLDRETARIDALVAEKQRMLALLEEKRAALISRAVTRGLNPNAPLKPSGLDWLGDIPVHWSTTKFSWSIFIIEGQVDPEVEPYSSMVLVAPNHIESRTGKLIDSETAADQGAMSGKYLCQRCDVIYSKIRPALRKVVLATEDCICSADMYPLRPQDNLNAEYLLFFLLSEEFSTWAILESERVAMPKINRETLGAIRLPLPSFDEQINIVAYIRKRIARIDRQCEAIKNSVALLKERRAALITAAVTGQIPFEEMSA
jgi:type I restriction enzyme, S subunit